jgi:hypothetical protein
MDIAIRKYIESRAMLCTGTDTATNYKNLLKSISLTKEHID